MRIHQITDLHVPEPEVKSYFGDVFENVIRQIAFIEFVNSDLLVISGDLTMADGSMAACDWIKSILPTDLRTVLIPGNHDDPAVLWSVFGQEICVDKRFFYTIDSEDDCKLIFVNSSTDHLPNEQIDYLGEQACEKRSILFIHHPPDLVSSGFMSINQPLQNYGEVSDAIRASTIDHVFCGHLHNTVNKECNGFNLHITPSPAFQVDLHAETFTMEKFVPGVRVIEISGDAVRTEVAYV